AEGLHASPEITNALTLAESQAATAVSVGWDGKVRGVLSLTDPVKPTSKAAVSTFRELGLRPVLLTGDSATTALAIAEQVGIDPDDVSAEVLRQDKVDQVG